MKRNRRLTVVCIGALLAGLLSFVAWDRTTPALGAKTCGACHPAQFAAWKQTAHAVAWQRLPEAHRDARHCQGCHSLGSEPELRGVQCESCHGLGGQYGQEHVMRDSKLAVAVGLVAAPSPQQCRRCHNDASSSLRPFDETAALRKMGDLCRNAAAPAPQR